MARKSPAEKQIDTRVGNAYRESCHGVVINIMDIGKVMNEGRRLVLTGASEEALRLGIRSFVEQIRVAL